MAQRGLGSLDVLITPYGNELRVYGALSSKGETIVKGARAGRNATISLYRAVDVMICTVQLNLDFGDAGTAFAPLRTEASEGYFDREIFCNKAYHLRRVVDMNDH